MTNLSSPRLRNAGIARQLALAVALASGTAVLAIPGFADAAHAQKRKKEEKADPAKPVYSKEFVAAYQPVEAALAAPGANVAALKPQILALAPLAISPDEQQAAGGMIYNAGGKASDPAMQLQGMEMLLGSGKVPPEQIGSYNFTGYQIANGMKDYGKARKYLQAAIDNNFTTERISKSELEITMAEIFFAEEQFTAGLDYLSKAIEARKAQGQPVDAAWYRRGISVAYSNEVVPQIYDLVVDWVADYPTMENWRDAVNLTRNLNDFDAPVMLDLLRLGKKVGTLKEKNDYIIYIEAADARRLPMEVKNLIDEARANGAIPKGADSYVDEQMGVASGRIAGDRADLPVLEKDADAGNAQLRTVIAAGDAFLSYGEYAKAARFYEKSLGMAGVDRNLALTRLGIAQIGAGNPAAARESLAKVDGVRAPVAKLWSAYAAQQGGVAAAAPVATSI